MTNNFSKYGAISAKVRAMYGKRLRESDWEALEAMRSVGAVVSYLKKHPGWEGPLSGLSPAGTSRNEIERTISDALMDEYIKLYKFAATEDKSYMMYPIYKFEYNSILARLRVLKSGSVSITPFAVPDFFRNKSKLDYASLSVANSWSGILSAGKDTIYYQALIGAQPPHIAQLPDYTAISVLVEGRYYEVMNKLVLAKYSGKTKDIFQSALGQEIDLLNLIHIMRLKRYFPKSPQAPGSMLFPVSYKLSRSFFNQIIAAPSYDSALPLMKNTIYGKFFTTHSFEKIEDYYRQKIYLFNRGQLLSAEPSPYTSTAYLRLKEFEIKRLSSIIERSFYAGINTP